MTTLNHLLPKEIFSIISKITGVEISDIISKKRDIESVDARHIYVKILSEYGYYPTCISVLTGITHRQVNNILTEFDLRVRYSLYMRNNLEAIRKELRNNALNKK